MTQEETFEQHRPLLFSIAYRMLGSAADAEDVVQDTYIRWQARPLEQIESPKNYLITAVTRGAINHLESARVRRETYVGQWLPEPLLTANMADPVELAESLKTAFLVLLESLSPTERAVFLLAEVFDYSMREVAAATGKSEPNCRQLLHRARESVNLRRRRYEAPDQAVENVLQQFGAAAYAGDVNGLLATLDSEAVLYSDGGGKAKAAINPVYGADRIARFFAGISSKGIAGTTAQFAEINRQPGYLIYRDGRLESTIAFEVADGRIRAIYITSNPDKLTTLRQEPTQ